MPWLPRLQQRLSITKNEALTLLSLSLFLLLGTAGRYMCRQMRPVPPGYYAHSDSLFAARTAAAQPDAAGADSGGRSSGRASGRVGGAHGAPAEIAASERATAGSLAREPATDPGGKMSTSEHAGRSQPERPARQAEAAAAEKMIDINEATAEELDRLPRVGPKIAERIIEFRRQYGRFQSVDELMSVRGIGATTLELIRPHARVGPPQSSGAARTSTASGTVEKDSIPQPPAQRLP